MQKALDWMKGQPVEVNREGFTQEEMLVEIRKNNVLRI